MKTSRRPQRVSAFTLIELLVVISVIAVLSGMLFSVLRAVNQKKLLSRARGELAQVQACIDAYKSKLGYYPPDNRNPVSGQLSPALNQLFYELAGTIFSNNVYVSKDRTAPALTPSMLGDFFGAGVTGFLTKHLGVTWDVRYFRSIDRTIEAGQSVGSEHLSFWRASMALAIRI